MKKLLWSSLLLVVGFSAVGQNKKLDSLLTLLNKHPQEDTIRVQLLNSICHLEYTSDNEKNKIHANEAFELAKKLRYKAGMGTALKYKALYYWVIGDYEQATTYALEMLRVFEGTSFHLGLSQAYNLLGLIHERRRDFEKAKDYYLKALDIRQKAGLKRDVAYSFNSLGSLSFSLSKYDEALDFFLKSLEIRKEIGDEEMLSQTYGNLAVVYMKKKDYATSLDYNKKSLAILEKSSNKYRTVVNYTNLGEVYTKLGRYKEAEHYLVKSIDIGEAMRHKEVLAEIYDKLTLLETSRSNYKQAFAYLELKHKYEDSLYTEKQSKQIADAEARYDADRKDQTILSLEQQKEFQNLKQLYLVIGLLILSVTFFVIYMLQRSHNQKKNALLENQKLLNQKLQEADQMKSKFFANISHEFRTPLTLILSPLEEKLASTSLARTDRESLQLVTRNASRLLSLVNQLLELSKLEAKKMELMVQEDNLNTFLSVVTASFDSLAETKNIHFDKSISLVKGEHWYDADKVEKIINNILFNAFKFTPSGGIVSFSASQVPTTHDLEIVVTDTGIGIPEVEQQNIFSPFYQSRNVGDDGRFGTGLGLSLVKELLKLYEGCVELDSTLNKGTTIKITLPITKDRIPSVAVFKDKDIDRAEISRGFNVPAKHMSYTSIIDDEYVEEQTEHEDTILIIEDNDDLRNFIASTLKGQFTTVTAKNGEEGFAVAVEQIPDLIISDVMMPVMDGIILTEKIKADERTCHIPVVLLTAKADTASKIEGLLTGADDFLSKPFSTEELRTRVLNLIAQRKKLAAKYSAGYSVPIAVAKEPSLDDKFLARARQIVVDNISDSSFGVEKMADDIHLSRTQLFRKLKAISGMSPNEFINEIRLQKAADLILSKADTLTQISYSVGFNEQSYFAKRFRKKFGVAPSEYTHQNTPQKV
jgi:signal transduction histidine kinase/DNA-binding response OmpR family regulator